MKSQGFSTFATLLLATTTLLAQAPPPPKNLVSNGGFEQASAQDNLWDGVDSQGYLTGWRRTVPAIAESGGVRDLAMPISVNFADINGDGVSDLLTADPAGFFRAYINEGSKTEPKFTTGEIIPLYLSKVQYPVPESAAPRIHFYDWSRRGMLDLIVGDYMGNLYVLPNAGSASAPDFRQPPDVSKATLPTSKSGQLWGNLLAPLATDWNEDGKPDLLVGEGSYSANSIHLLINKSASTTPEFTEDARFYLAYGDGREHLVPALADYNGDGTMDLLVSDRSGEVGVYLNPGGTWKAGTELKFSSFITFGGQKSVGAMPAICTADYNGDGQFDILIGKNNGHIAVAINKGAKGQPLFDAPVEIKGVDLWGRNITPPVGWSVDAGRDKANMFGYISVVKAEQDPEALPVEGKGVLKCGYFPPTNKVFKKPALNLPGLDSARGHHFSDAAENSYETATSTMHIKKNLPLLTIGATYTLSFKVKGKGAQNAQYVIALQGYARNTKIEKINDRGAVNQTGADLYEEKLEEGKISPGSTWTTITKTFTVTKFKAKEMAELTKTNAATFEVNVSLPPYESNFYMDDVQLTLKE